VKVSEGRCCGKHTKVDLTSHFAVTCRLRTFYSASHSTAANLFNHTNNTNHYVSREIECCYDQNRLYLTSLPPTDFLFTFYNCASRCVNRESEGHCCGKCAKIDLTSHFAVTPHCCLFLLIFSPTLSQLPSTTPTPTSSQPRCLQLFSRISTRSSFVNPFGFSQTYPRTLGAVRRVQLHNLTTT
jgi:hypothetical protein